jgi:hypothetical protein
MGDMAMSLPCRNMVKARLTLSLLPLRARIILTQSQKGAFAYAG